VHYSDSAKGNFALLSQLLFYSGQTNLGTGAANQPHTSRQRRVRVAAVSPAGASSNRGMTDRYYDTASPVAFPPGTITAVLSTIPPAVTGLGFLDTPRPNYTQVAQLQPVSRPDVLFDLTSKLTLRGGLPARMGRRHGPRRAAQASRALWASGQLSRNVGLAGLTFRAAQKLSVNLDTRAPRATAVYFRTSLNDYYKLRARGALPGGCVAHVAGQFPGVEQSKPGRVHFNTNFESRDNSLAVLLDSRRRQAHHSDGRVRPLQPRFQHPITWGCSWGPAVSNYRENAHTASSTIDFALARLRRLERPSHRWRIAISYPPAAGPRATTKPLMRLSLPLQKHVYWNTEWKYYGYGEQFYLY